jgi:hypothetical protein
MHALLVLRADAIEGCLEGSEEVRELVAITDAIEAYETIRCRWDEHKMERASKPGQSRTQWGHSARDRRRNREDNSVSVVDHDGWCRYSVHCIAKGTWHGGTLFNGGEEHWLPRT